MATPGDAEAAAAAAEKRKVDLRFLLAKYGTKDGKKIPYDEETPKPPKYLESGFCIQFRLSKAYRQIARQEVEAAKPEGLPVFRKRKKKKCVTVAEPAKKPEVKKKDLARERLTAAAAAPSFWKQMIMSKVNSGNKADDKMSKRSSKRPASSRGTDVASTRGTEVASTRGGSIAVTNTAAPSTGDQQSVKSIGPASSAVQEWERRKQRRREEKLERKQKLQTLGPASAPRRPRPASAHSSTTTATILGVSSPILTRHGSCRARPEAVPVITMKTPKYIIGQPHRRYDEVNPDPFRELLKVRSEDDWEKVQTEVDGDDGDEEGVAHEDKVVDEPEQSAQDKLKSLEKLVSSGEDLEERDLLPDPHVVVTKSEDGNNSDKVKTGGRESASENVFKTAVQENDSGGEEEDVAEDSSDESETDNPDRQKLEGDKSNGVLDKRKADGGKDPGGCEQGSGDKALSATSILLQKFPSKASAGGKKKKGAESPVPDGPGLRPAKFLYTMCNCQKVSPPEKLENKLTGKKKYKKVVGVINVYGCKKEEQVKKHHEMLSRMSKPRRGQTVVVAIDEPAVKCPFCSTRPERRIKGWLAGIEDTGIDVNANVC